MAKKNKHQSNKVLAKQQKPVIEEKKHTKAYLLFSTLIKSLKISIPVGTLLFFVGLWFSYYPEKLKVTDKLIGKYDPISSAIIIENYNRYDVNNVEIKVKTKASFKMSFGLFSNITSNDKYTFKKISSQKSVHVKPNFIKLSKGLNNDFKISKAEVTVVISYEPLFLYKEIKNDTTVYTVVLDSDGNSVYLNK